MVQNGKTTIVIMELATQIVGFDTVMGLNLNILQVVGYDLTQVDTILSNVTTVIIGITYILALTLMQSIGGWRVIISSLNIFIL